MGERQGRLSSPLAVLESLALLGRKRAAECLVRYRAGEGGALSLGTGHRPPSGIHRWARRIGRALVGMLVLVMFAHAGLGLQQDGAGSRRDEVEGGVEQWPACTARSAESYLIGDVDSALAAALVCLTAQRHEPICAYTAACCYARKGDVDSALEWLERSADWGGRTLPLLREDPDLEALREDPRFLELVALAELREGSTVGDGSGLDAGSIDFGGDSIAASALDVHPFLPLLAVGWNDGCLDVVSLTTWRRVKRLSEEWVLRSSIRFIEGGTLVASIVDGPKVVIWDVQSGTVISDADLPSVERGASINLKEELRASREGDALAILTRGGEVMIASREGAWEANATVSYAWALRDIAWGPNGNLYGVAEDTLLSLSLLSGPEWSVVAGSMASTGCRGLAVSPSGMDVAVFGTSTTVGVAVVNVESGDVRLSKRTSFLGSAGPFWAAFSPTGSRILLTGGSGRVWMMALADLSELWSVDYHCGTPFPIRCSFIGVGDNLLVARNIGGTGHVLAAGDGSAIGEFPCGPGSGFALHDDGIASIIKGKVAYTPVRDNSWTLLYGRPSGDSEVVVARDGRFAASKWSAVSKCSISLAGERRSLADEAEGLHDPHGIRVLLGGL